VFGNRRARRIFANERKRVRALNRMHSVELRHLYSPCNITGVMKFKLMGFAGYAVEIRNAYRVLAENPEHKSSLGRHRSI
jgi:hypothetical protein